MLIQKQSQDNPKNKQPSKINIKRVKKQIKDNLIMAMLFHRTFPLKTKRIQMQSQRVSAMGKPIKLNDFRFKHLQRLQPMKIRLSLQLTISTMLVIPLIQNFQQQEIEFWLIELVSWIRFLRERLLLKDLMMMGKMEQVKSFCIFYRKWKLKILL